MRNSYGNQLLINKVLVLNKCWFPIGTFSLKNAFCKLLSKRVRALNHITYNVCNFYEWFSTNSSGFNYIKTSSGWIAVPEIVISSYYEKVPKFKASASRKNILKRDKYTCQYSGKKLPEYEATIDHVVPKSKGGKNSWQNCVTSSFSINNEKSDKFLEETDLRLISEPGFPKNNLLFQLPCSFNIPDSWKTFLFKKKNKI
jgi:5-methylcytosine-specific restriction endonuclease McrA